jgi:hypothetical protein
MSTKVIIPQRNEPLTAWTAKRVLETAPSVDEVIIVNDGEQDMPCKETRKIRVITPWKDWKGTAPARDAGILAAGVDCDHVILLDAHMNFPSSFDWAERLVTRCNSLGDQAIVGAGSCVIDHKTYQMKVADTEKGIAFGTNISLMSGGDKKGNVTSPRHVFESKWRDKYGTLPGLCQSVLGACYCFSRTWYIQDLHRPWNGMEHWGTLEQSLTIPNWLAGGDCYVESFPIGHLYRSGHQVPYQQDNAMRWYNKFRLVEILPMEDSTRAKLRAHLMKNPEVTHRFDDIKAAMERNQAANAAIKAHLANYEVTVEDYIQAWAGDEKTGMKVADIRAALKDRKVKAPAKSKKPALEKILTDTLADEMRGNRPAFGVDGEIKKAESRNGKPKPQGTRPYIQNKEAIDPGVKCAHCGRRLHLLDKKAIEVTHTYPNGNRRVICGHCNMPFIIKKG